MRLTWPSMQLAHVGEFESSKSAMNTRAPELSALITIFRSVGPVISTRRSCRPGGSGAIAQCSRAREGEASGGEGAIVVISSVQGHVSQPGVEAYAASKGGIVGMTLPIARELARSAWESGALDFFRWFAAQPALDGRTDGCAWFVDLRFVTPGRDIAPFQFGACREESRRFR